MITTGKEKRDKIQSCLGQSFCPGVKKTAEGYEFTLEVPQGSNASLILYGQDENLSRREILEKSVFEKNFSDVSFERYSRGPEFVRALFIMFVLDCQRGIWLKAL